MLTKRIIACLDIKDGRTVKGTNFIDLKDAGDPVELASKYAEQGIDELVFLDITATNEKRKTLAQLVDRIAKNINIPFTVGGGISSIEDVRMLLDHGADKISINTAAFNNPVIIDQLAREFGSQCIVIAVDTKLHNDGECYVYLNGGRKPTEIKCLDWVHEAAERGAGEVLLTSMDHDGTKQGFAKTITGLVTKSVSVPVIASGGGGKPEHFLEILDGLADAALAASIFHFGEINIPDLKTYLSDHNILVRQTH